MSTRRNFLKQSALATSAWLIPGFLKAFDGKPMAAGERRLVVIQLSGGNDGLNTVVPYRNDVYYQLRPQLGLPAESVIRVHDELGFHPALKKLADLYHQGELAVLNNVGYPNPDRSHFRSMDIWHTAADSSEYLSTGWLGRFLDARCQDRAAGHFAIEVDDVLTLALKGRDQKGMAMRHPQKLHDVLQRDLFQQLATVKAPDQDSSVSYLYKTLAQTVSSIDYIHEKTNKIAPRGAYPATDFAGRLKTMAQLIQSGIDTRVYYASLAGFDTHVRQANDHARLLQTFSEAIDAFVADLKKQGALDDTLIMVFSEFGRRVAQNASAGTDHGTANNVFLIGSHLRQRGFLNGTPDLIKLDAGDLIHTLDFRSLYATVLDRWLQADADRILGKSFARLDLV